MRTNKLLLGCALLIASHTAWGADAAFDGLFTGTWRINMEETDKVTVRYEEGSGMKGLNPGKVTVSVMGLPLPSSAKTRSRSGLPAKDPEVLTCTSMNIAPANSSVKLSYDAGATETLRKGDYRGRSTRMTKAKIEQTYKTSERHVRKTWSVRDDGRMLVSVRIKYKGDKARTYNRVFDKEETATAG